MKRFPWWLQLSPIYRQIKLHFILRNSSFGTKILRDDHPSILHNDPPSVRFVSSFGVPYILLLRYVSDYPPVPCTSSSFGTSRIILRRLTHPSLSLRLGLSSGALYILLLRYVSDYPLARCTSFSFGTSRIILRRLVHPFASVCLRSSSGAFYILLLQYVSDYPPRLVHLSPSVRLGLSSGAFHSLTNKNMPRGGLHFSPPRYRNVFFG